MRIDARISIHHTTNISQLRVALFAQHGELQELLPNGFDYTGQLHEGVILMEPGPYRVSYCGDKPDSERSYDMVSLDPHRVGAPEEACAPQDVTCTCADGVVVLDPLPYGEWIPQWATQDLRVRRVLAMLGQGLRAKAVVQKLTPRDRSDYQYLITGRIDPQDCAAHVRILAQRTREPST